MDKDQIKKIARDYAEEYYKVRGGTELMADEAENVIRFVLRRYCLVEKDAVRKEYEDCYRQYLAAGNARPLRQQYFFGRCFAVMFLFPEIAKEVEDAR